MEDFKTFDIPFKGAKLGINEYLFQVDDEFFKKFESSPVESGVFDVKVILDKKESILDFQFVIQGSFKAPCDRCLAEISIGVEDEKKLLVKFDDLGKEDTDEVVYIGSEETMFNIAEVLYEFVSLSIPLSKTIDCEENDRKFCDQKVLKIYDRLAEDVEKAEQEDKEESNIWDDLKDIKLN